MDGRAGIGFRHSPLTDPALLRVANALRGGADYLSGMMSFVVRCGFAPMVGTPFETDMSIYMSSEYNFEVCQGLCAGFVCREGDFGKDFIYAGRYENCFRC